MKFKVLARHSKWVSGATITELVSEDGNLRRFVATIRGYRNWPILVCPTADASAWAKHVVERVKQLRDRIDAKDESVFAQSSELGPEFFRAASTESGLFWDMANLYFPKGCECGNNGDGSCDWCRVYYGDDKPWIDEEGRELPLPSASQTLKGRDVQPPRVDSSRIPGKLWPQSCEIKPGVFVTTDLSLADGPRYWMRKTDQ